MTDPSMVACVAKWGGKARLMGPDEGMAVAAIHQDAMFRPVMFVRVAVPGGVGLLTGRVMAKTTGPA